MAHLAIGAGSAGAWQAWWSIIVAQAAHTSAFVVWVELAVLAKTPFRRQNFRIVQFNLCHVSYNAVPSPNRLLIG